MTEDPKYTNRLIKESSPYLLQHAHNPVDWFPWGDEAFEKAKAEDKPVLLSIGYSACHWCHVMEHESFQDEETARLMNERFVSIKVDMEERPDIDKIYMNFVQMTSGGGGWPLNVFLTPDRLPFFGGTYFPPVNSYNRPSFRNVLNSIADAFQNKRDEIDNSANDILLELRRVGNAGSESGSLTSDLLDAAFLTLKRTFDAANGGFGGAPKFPATMSLEFLLRYYKRTGDEDALKIVETTCRKMANGGIYDQLGGGFHRYAVDANWLTPHFEKMAYDNAQLIRLYLHLFQQTKDQFFRRVAVETLEYVRREMLDESGGFYSAQDADSEGVEGKFFVWSFEEIVRILGEESARVFCEYYDVSTDGNFEGENILNVPKPLSQLSAELNIPEPALDELLESARAKLFAVREERTKPFRDEKVLTAWNGLMLAAFAEASAVLQEPEYLKIAVRNADFVISRMQRNGMLLRSWKNGTAKLNAYVEDYANFVDALIELFQVSGEGRYLAEAIRLAGLMIDGFWDHDGGGFFFTASDHEELLVRNKDFYDNATPSGNSAAADAFLKLAKLTGDDSFERFAVAIIRLSAPQLKRFPSAFGRTLATLEFYLNPVFEIVIAGDDGRMSETVWNDFIPGKVVILVNGDSDVSLIPLIENKAANDGKPTAYVCIDRVCQRPATTPEELQSQLS